MRRAWLATLLTGCNWISLGANAATYQTLAAGEAGNIVATDSLAFATLGDSGIAVLNGRTGARIGVMLPPDGMESVDDLATADGLLFLLDARKPGHLASVSLASRAIVHAPQSVNVGPFSGISAARGICIVSGGTSLLTVWRYHGSGPLTQSDSADLGRGQPDVLVDPTGARAYVSTHYWGPYFGLNVFAVEAPARAVAKVEIDGAGFTTGGAKPANFPMDAALLGDHIVLLAHARGVAVLDVATGRVERVIDVGGPAVSIDVKENEAAVAVAGRTPALVVLQLGATSERVVRRVTFEPGTKPAGVAFSGNNVLVAARDRGVLVVQR